MFPRLEAADEYVLTLDVVPFVHTPEVPSQRLIVSVNDTVVGSTDLSRPTLLGYRIPAGLARRSDRMLITLQHPDAARPKDVSDIDDDRYLAFALTEAKLYRITEAEQTIGQRLPPGLMLGLAHERSFGTQGPVDLAEWAMNRTGLTVPQIALKFESVGEIVSLACFNAAAMPNRLACCVSPARSCATWFAASTTALKGWARSRTSTRAWKAVPRRSI